MTDENPDLEVIDKEDGTVTLRTGLGTVHVRAADSAPNGVLVATTDFDVERKDEHADETGEKE